MEEGRAPRIVIAVLACIAIGSLIYFFVANKQAPAPDISGAESQDEQPVTPSPDVPTDETTAVKVYFHKITETDCAAVYPITRRVTKTALIGTASLKQLFAGPTTTEQLAGYSSIFSPQTADILNRLQVKNGTAYVNLKDIKSLLPQVSASCGSTQFLAEATNTLKQFSTVQRVVFALEADVEAFYEWVGLGCSEENAFCDNTVYKRDLVKVEQPVSGNKVASPVEVTGEARGSWFFEASFPVKVYNNLGNEIGRGVATTKQNWMTSDFVPFQASISITPGAAQSGVVVLQKDNPSGLPENADSVRVFVKF